MYGSPRRSTARYSSTCCSRELKLRATPVIYAYASYMLDTGASPGSQAIYPTALHSRIPLQHQRLDTRTDSAREKELENSVSYGPTDWPCRHLAFGHRMLQGPVNFTYTP